MTKFSLFFIAVALNASVIGQGSFTSYLNSDGGYNLSFREDNVFVNIELSPSICCIFKPDYLPLFGGMSYGSAGIDDIESGKFYFFWSTLQLLDNSNRVMATANLDIKAVETSFTMQREPIMMSQGTFDIVNDVPEANSLWMITVGLILLFFRTRNLPRLKLSSFRISNYFS
jgi:hypothetical protein